MWAIILDGLAHNVEVGVAGMPAGLFLVQDLGNPVLYRLTFMFPPNSLGSHLLVELYVEGDYRWPALSVRP